MKDKEVTCKECNRIFVIRSSELESFSARKKPIPQYCPLCYKRYRAEKAAERKQREDLAWQKKKVLEIQHYHDALNSLQGKLDILPLEEVAPDTEDKVLSGIIREGRFLDFNYTEFPKNSSLEI